MRATLKRSLGEAAAFIDDSHGEDRLYEVLKALAGQGETLSGRQDAVTADVLASIIVDEETTLKSFRTVLGTTGSAGQTDVELKVNGSTVATLSTTNAEADGMSKAATGLPLDLEAGDLVEIEVTAAPTAGANLTATARLGAVTVE